MSPRRRILIAALALGLLGAVVAGVGIAGTRTPARLSLPAARATAGPSPAPAADPLAAACGSLPTSAAGTGLAGNWVVGAGAEAGFRAHEKFADIPAPHEAVARTDRVAGWMTVRDDGSALEITTACIAIELGSLRSVDTVPGLNTRDRDGAVRDLLNVADHPFARFAIATPVRVQRGLATEGGGSAVVEGALEINGTSRAATVALQARTSRGTQILAAGSTVVVVEDYGVEVPKAADFIVVDSHITLEFAIALQRP